MAFRCIWRVGFVLFMCLSVVAGCDFGPRRIHPPSVVASTAAQAAIAEYDSDKDGKISGAELDKCAALKSCLKKLDRSGDGITAQGIQEAIEHWQMRGFGRVTYSCVVTHSNRPLVGATVKFVPEKFLGDSYPVASGLTNEQGVAAISIPNVEPAGLAVGFYRVEITKDGEAIPAQYNTESTLGAGILQPLGTGDGPTFNLKY